MLIQSISKIWTIDADWSAEKAAAEKAAAEKAAAEKATGEKAVAEKAVAEKAAGEKAVVKQIATRILIKNSARFRQMCQ